VKLGTKGRYAVMAMVDLASQCEDCPVSICEVAERQQISPSYLEQLFAKLRRGGIVDSARGPGGGYKLNRPAREIRIADIFLAVGETVEATRCGKGSPIGCAKAGARCKTHDLWSELGNQISLFLNAVTLADVVEGHVLGMSGRLYDDTAEQAAAE
jgi:Rrf2 family iron-sulfur cluster assembly transcriptional regulator